MDSLWKSLEVLRKYEAENYNEPSNKASTATERHLTEFCVATIEAITLGVIDNLASGQSPVLRIPRKSPFHNSESSVKKEDLVSAADPKSARRFVLLTDVLSKSHALIKSDSYATLRDVYYTNCKLYEKQQTLDKTVEEVARIIGVPRRCLHITATAKGLIAGNLTFYTHDNIVVSVADAREGVMIPSYIEGIHGLTSQARFILIVEKDATFQSLLQSEFLSCFRPCILVTGKGYPDLCTRQMVYRLWAELKIPVLALVDADPYGLHIAAVYKFGALARDDPNLKISGLVLLGILPSDLKELHLPEKALLPLDPRDHGKLASLEAHPALQKKPEWLSQIRCLRELGVKAEIQSLAHISPDFLTRVYLPAKISSGSWIV